MSRILISATAFLALVGCASQTSHVPPENFLGTTLDNHTLIAKPSNQYLSIDLNAEDSELRRSEVQKLEGFLADFADHGHGPLMLSIPNSGPNAALAVRAAVQARDMAWETGVNYEDIVGMAYDATNYKDAPMVLAFKAYDVVRPNCKQLGAYDFTNAVSNSDMPSLGCAVRANMAAMIADPADLLGTRPLESGDNDRRVVQLLQFRDGEYTGANRDASESVAISGAIE